MTKSRSRMNELQLHRSEYSVIDGVAREPIRRVRSRTEMASDVASALVFALQATIYRYSDYRRLHRAA